METVLPIFACFWGLALLAGLVLWPLNILIVSNLRQVFPADYIEAGSADRNLFGLRRLGGSDFCRYILSKRYENLPDKSLVRMCRVSRVLTVYVISCFLIFLAGMFIGVIYIYVTEWPF
jgi:hypothetical protein